MIISAVSTGRVCTTVYLSPRDISSSMHFTHFCHDLSQCCGYYWFGLLCFWTTIAKVCKELSIEPVKNVLNCLRTMSSTLTLPDGAAKALFGSISLHKLVIRRARTPAPKVLTFRVIKNKWFILKKKVTVKRGSTGGRGPWSPVVSAMWIWLFI